jgi:hypothetical protein
MRQSQIASQLKVTALAGAALLAGSGLLEGTAGAAVPYTDQFPLEQCTFVPNGRNLHFSIQPGDVRTLAGDDQGEQVVNVITVLDEKRQIQFVTENGVPLTVQTRVVEERESVNGELVEVSRNFFSRCEETSDIYYFGEEVDIFDGGGVSHTGSWLAGENGALPGLIMPGTFLLGSRYFQERAPGVAEDRAKHVAMGFTIEVPAGVFSGCVRVRESSPLDAGAKSTKVYCPGIGLVKDDVTELVELQPPH